MTDEVTQEMIRSRLLYNREQGRLIWLPRPRDDFQDENKWAVWNTRYAGSFAGHVGTKGYRCLRLFGKTRKASRVTWVWHYGVWPDVIDHINGQTDDDHIENLRDVTQAENCLNRKVSVRNASGVPGVFRDGKKFRAEISFNNRKFYLGIYSDVEQAIAARKEAEKRFGYHPNHGRAA